MRLNPIAPACLLLALTAFAPASPGVEASSQVQPDAVLLRYPDVSADHIVFRYSGDLWLVDKTGGEARRLTSAPGNESLPRFSPDGSEVAFLGGYEGGTDIYSLSIEAGAPQRLTWHPAQEIPCGWTPDGENVLFWSNATSGLARAPRIFQVGRNGGQPEALPVAYGTFCSLDATGEWLAYTPNSREFRTWKRYRGGMAQEIWAFHLPTGRVRRVTDHPGTDSMPMWHGRDVVFLSDRGENGRMNLHAWSMDTGSIRALTDFADVDVKFPSMGPDDVVFEAGGHLYRYEFSTSRSVRVNVTVPGERPHLRAQNLDVSDLVVDAAVGPSGTRLLVEARGEIFDVPAEEGVTRNLTRTDGQAERSPAWSPDGSWMVFFSDASGEYELVLRRIDGKSFDGSLGTDSGGHQKRLTSIGPGWKSSPNWAPDSKKLVFSTNDGGLHLYDIEADSLQRIGLNPSGRELGAGWSHDSAWLTWSHRHSESRMDAIYLFDVVGGELHEVSSGMFDDSGPVFDRDGDWLFFESTRIFDPIYADLDTTWIYANTRNLMAVPLREDVENPFAVKNPEETTDGDDDDPDDDPDDDADDADEDEDDADADDADDEDADDADDDADDEEPALQIDLEGFERRAMLLDAAPGVIRNLVGGSGRVYYVRRPRTGASGGEPTLAYYDLESDEEKTVLAGVAGYSLSHDAKKILVRKGAALGVIDAAPDQSFEAVDLGGLVTRVDPRSEWAQMLDDVWRIFRDYFYDEGMHGLDWTALRDRYRAALVDVTSRGDLHFLIGEMIAELNVGHAYNRTPPTGMDRAGPVRSIGMLGCDWSLEDGAFKIARILGGDGEYDADARSPLSGLGVDVAEGDWVLAVNGIPIDPSRTVYAAFEGTAGRPTELVVNRAPSMDGNERHVLVEPIGSESSLRYRDWVARQRAHVAAVSGGTVGYVHVPDTGQNGQNELMRQFLGQMHKPALIIDERWNGGGQIPTRFIELLDRPITNFWALRHGEDWDWPRLGHRGPKAMLINGMSGSGGDAFPFYFRQSGLGPLIGTRTWGGLVGISGNPALIDGGSQSVPRFAFFEFDGTWGIEGHGVDPDIDVLDDPAQLAAGVDPQLEAAIAWSMTALETWEFPPKNRPAGPDRRGSGITPEDH